MPIVRPDGSVERVEAWAQRPLPFCDGTQRADATELRNQLRAAVGQLTPFAAEILRGTYVSQDRAQRGDAENRLFYNLEALGQSARWGIRFERVFQAPPPSDVPAARAHHRYECVPQEQPWSNWSPSPAVAEVSVRVPDGEPDVCTVWREARSRGITRLATLPADAYFGVRVTLTVPATSRVRQVPLERMKKIFDGVICALHSHRRDEKTPEVTRRLARRLETSSDEIERLLLDSTANVLEVRRLVWPRKEGLQWNPADGRCVCGEFLLVRGAGREAVQSIMGTVFGVIERR